MKDTIDQIHMNRYGKRMTIFLLLTALSMGAAFKYSEGWFGFLGPIVLWGIAMYCAIKVDKIKKKHDVKTFNEILDYMENGVKTKTTPINKMIFYTETVLVVTGVVTIFLVIALLSEKFFEWLSL